MHKKDDSYSSKNKSNIKKNEKNYDFFNKNKININNENNFIMNENINSENNIFININIRLNIYKMSENSGTVNNEKSFFDDKSYYNIESSKKSQNDSSNPEKEYNL